jgi:hypothetical protein
MTADHKLVAIAAVCVLAHPILCGVLRASLGSIGIQPVCKSAAKNWSLR